MAQRAGGGDAGGRSHQATGADDRRASTGTLALLRCKGGRHNKQLHHPRKRERVIFVRQLTSDERRHPGLPRVPARAHRGLSMARRRRPGRAVPVGAR
ncbi:hypothetical protein PF011_g1138 [Phytophthora fragariae]|uniref:Uncharacterized protein n=1 Tax=Phytophthora fragariae TaxID=53985 RepID=A0A6A3MMF4_9STRA|nr:hypothetical protein PF011_g1138 [Phytophthora fragariae]